MGNLCSDRLFSAFTFIVFGWIVHATNGLSGRQLRAGVAEASHPKWKLRDCPCNNTAFCEPITARVDREVFIFSLSRHNWPLYDWERVTTVVQFGFHDDDLMCYAHSKQARVVFMAKFDAKSLPNATARHEWVLEKVQFAQENFLDGINVDFETNIPDDKPEERKGLTDLMLELHAAFHVIFKHTQVSMDLWWSPPGIYDSPNLVKIVDYVFIMAYDELYHHSPVAWGNSPYNQTKAGIERYLEIRTQPQKLILGLPWYGYVYECYDYNKENHLCGIKRPKGTSNLPDDNNGSQVKYKDILPRLSHSFTGRLWDKDAKSPYFSYYTDDNRTIHQMWYDDPKSLSMKIHLLDVYSLGGTGMWEADYVDYADTPDAKQQRDSMWQTFPKRKKLQ